MRNRKKLKKHVVTDITTAKQIFDHNLGDECTAYRTAQKYGICRNVLQKAFKEEYGEGIRDYRLRIRMEKSDDYFEDVELLFYSNALQYKQITFRNN